MAIQELRVSPQTIDFLKLRLENLMAQGVPAQPTLNCANDVVLFELFNSYSARGDATNSSWMNHSQYRVFLKELSVVKGKFTLASADILFKRFVDQEEGGKANKRSSSTQGQHQMNKGNDTKLEFSEFVQLVDALALQVAGEGKKQAFFKKKVLPLLEEIVAKLDTDKAAAPPRSIRSPAKKEEADSGVAKKKEALDQLPSIVRNKKQLMQIYEFFSSSKKTLNFKGLLGFAKAFELLPGLYDMARLQQMFHLVQDGSKSIDTMTKLRFFDFLDRTAQLLAETVEMGPTAAADQKMELLLAAMDNSSGKSKMDSGRGGFLCHPFKVQSASAQLLKGTVSEMIKKWSKSRHAPSTPRGK